MDVGVADCEAISYATIRFVQSWHITRSAGNRNSGQYTKAEIFGPPDSLALERENHFPVIFHADDCPALLLRFVVERLGERADFVSGKGLRGTVGIFAFCVVVEHEQRAARRRPPWSIRASAGRRSSCQRRVRAAADDKWMPSGLPASLSFSSELGFLGEDGWPSLS